MNHQDTVPTLTNPIDQAFIVTGATQENCKMAEEYIMEDSFFL
jgi:hypothetical protein